MTKAMLTRSFKDALDQSLRENRDAVRDLLAEVIEDVAMVNAIRASERSKPVKRDAVMKALAARMIARGCKPADVAAAMKISRQGLWKWRRTPAFIAELRRLHELLARPTRM